MDFAPTRERALDRLAQFLPAAGRRYAETRNADDGPGPDGAYANVSQLSPWLHAGLLGEREVLEAVLGQHSPRAAVTPMQAFAPPMPRRPRAAPGSRPSTHGHRS